MKKETFTEKLIKHTYGITGPLDEQKRREADRIGNISFIFLYYLLIFGNAIAFCLAFFYPTVMAFTYPAFLTTVLMIFSFDFLIKTFKNRLTTIDTEDLSSKDQKQLRFAGVKMGLYFGTGMFFMLPFMQVLIDHKDYLTELLSIKNFISFLFQALFMGIVAHIQIKIRLRQAQKDQENLDD